MLELTIPASNQFTYFKQENFAHFYELTVKKTSDYYGETKVQPYSTANLWHPREDT